VQRQKIRNWAVAGATALLLGPIGAAQSAAQQAQSPQSAAQAVAVAAVEVEGNRRVTEDQLRATIGIRAGDSIVNADVHRAVQRLWATALFRDVKVAARTDPANPTGPVTLRFTVDEQPLITAIEFRGLENVRASMIRDTVGLKTGPYSPRAASEAEAMTRQALARKGFRLRSITHRVEPVPGQSAANTLIFEIEEGQRVAIADIEFTGNEVFDDERLRDELRTKAEGFFWFRPGTFDEDRLRDDLRGALPAFYASNGYIDFAVVSDSVAVDPVTGKARLIVEVAEGPQYRLARFDVRGASRYPQDDLRRYFEQRRTGFLSNVIGGRRERGTQAGEVFDAIAFQAATTDVQRLYTNTGYLYAQVRPVVERVPATAANGPQVNIAWEIQEGRPASIRRVVISGNTFTHENVIRNQLLVLPGDIYSEELLIQSYRRLSALGFFETPLPTPQIQETGDGDVDLVFVVKEKQTGSVNFGTSLGGSLGLMGFLGYDQPNLFGKAKTGHLRWEFGRYSNNFEASYSDPAILDSWLSGSLALFSSRDRFFTFREGQRRRTGGSLRLGIPFPGDRWTRVSMGYSLSRTTYQEFDEEESSSIFSLPAGVQSTVTFGLNRSTIDHPLFPTVGTRLDLEANMSGGVLGGHGDFQKYTATGAWYVPVGSLGSGAPGSRPVRFTLGLTLEAGALFGNATRFPFERFWMGGVQFGRPLRGYEETTITPRGYIPRDVNGVPLEDRFGDAFLRMSSELAVRFTDNISVGVFYDAGNVWLEPSEMNPTRLLRGAGVGLMLVTPFGPLGLDYAYGFDKDKPGWQLHFKFGQGF
jgi:outer membrane protein insertion porin family